MCPESPWPSKCLESLESLEAFTALLLIEMSIVFVPRRNKEQLDSTLPVRGVSKRYSYNCTALNKSLLRSLLCKDRSSKFQHRREERCRQSQAAFEPSLKSTQLGFA